MSVILPCVAPRKKQDAELTDLPPVGDLTGDVEAPDDLLVEDDPGVEAESEPASAFGPGEIEALAEESLALGEAMVDALPQTEPGPDWLVCPDCSGVGCDSCVGGLVAP